ncbi:MAG: ribonuclease P protein component [Rhodocyclales bacterium]|nr:ribonuclease P protein component [Rhodocyclales bacterium]
MAGQSDRGFGFGTLDRLHRPEEFGAVKGSRTRLSGGCFELRYRLRQSGAAGLPGERARLGLIVPKRLAKRAVLRNLLKRLAREAFRNAAPGLPPMDMVLRLAKPPLAAGGQADRPQRLSWRKTLDELLTGVPR